jgi:HJR/Mrr/RecB family endonuclease
VSKRSTATDYPLTAPGVVLLCVLGLGLWLSSGPLVLIGGVGSMIVFGIQAEAAKRRNSKTLGLQDLRALSHRDLEHHVAAVIAALPGWKAEATRGGSDQGADVIATSPRGTRVAIQVKHYAKNVSNGAVQEIVAAKAIYKCIEAVVFTSGPGYTKSAIELARANGVKLWGPDDLFRLQAQASAKQAAPRELLPA